MADFADRLKEYRQANKLSQSELAAILRSSKQVISRYELRQRFPQAPTVTKFAERLGVDPAWLIGYDDEIPKNENPKRKYLMDKVAKADDRTLTKIDKLMRIIDDEEINNPW